VPRAGIGSGEEHDMPTTTPPPIDRFSTLARLATEHAAASRVFQHYGLDFCCAGEQSLDAACRQRRLDADEVVAALQEAVAQPHTVRWDERPRAQLLAHLVEHYHEGHRRELPRLIAMAEKVEHVHGGKADCPRGLAQHLRHVQEAMEEHMQKEEQVLFPLLLGGQDALARAPIACMEAEHEDHGKNLERLRVLAHDFVPPALACGTWRALYLGLAELEREVMEHVHLENHVLFAGARR
jgi:regulator of cell morphogenesis and NO signaling